MQSCHYYDYLQITTGLEENLAEIIRPVPRLAERILDKEVTRTFVWLSSKKTDTQVVKTGRGLSVISLATTAQRLWKREAVIVWGI